MDKIWQMLLSQLNIHMGAMGTLRLLFVSVRIVHCHIVWPVNEP